MVGRGNTKKHCKSPWILSIEFDVFTRYFYLETLKHQRFSMVYIVMFSVIANPYSKISRISNRTWESRPYDSCLKQICLKSGPQNSSFSLHLNAILSYTVYPFMLANKKRRSLGLAYTGWTSHHPPPTSMTKNDSTGQKNRALFLRLRFYGLDAKVPSWPPKMKTWRV